MPKFNTRMVTVAKRIRDLQTKLLNIRLGPGAAILPRSITRLHLDFAFRLEGGHLGARKFWREMLPRLKYHNPAISMTVSRQNNPAPAFLNIYVNKQAEKEDSELKLPSTVQASDNLEFAEVKPVEKKTTTAPFNLVSSELLKDATPKFSIGKMAPLPEPHERIVQINLLERNERDIWEEFSTITKAMHIEPTVGESETLKDLQQQKERSLMDSERGKKIRDQIKREKELMKMATQAFQDNIAEEASAR